VFGTLIHSKLKPAAYVSKLLKYNLIATVASLDTAKFLDQYSRRLNKKFKVHIKVDTGMKRIGFDVKNAFKNIEQIFTYKNLEIEGIFTHFATSESGDKAFAKSQLNKFKELLHMLKQAGMEFPIVHAANSGAILDLKDSYFDMVRPGLLLYGYYPSDEVKNKIELMPIMSLKSKVTFIKRVETNTSISYGRKYFTADKTFIGSVPVVGIIIALIPDACRYRIFCKLIVRLRIICAVVTCSSHIFGESFYVMRRYSRKLDWIISRSPVRGCSHVHTSY
jgi:alanine racemase